MLEAEVRQLFRLHHQRVELFQRGDLVGGAHLARVLGVAGVEPAGIHTGVQAALDVGQQIVADHQHTALVRDAEVTEGVLKQLGAGLGRADLLGNIDAVHVPVDAGGRNAGLLHGNGTVRDEGQRGDLAQLLQRGQCAGQQVGMGRQQLLIAVIHGLALAVVGQLHGLHEAGEADLEQFLQRFHTA